eukprot:g32527.t1
MNYDEMNAAELASLPVQAEQQSMSAPQPTLEPTICASALKRRLETWKFRSVAPLRVSSEAKEDVVDAPLCFDADFESGSLGPVTVLGESEYEDEPTKLPNPFHGNEEFTDMAYLISFTSTNGPQMWLNRVLEVQLLSDANGGYVQWFCFRVRQMKVGMPYTFHLTNLIKPGSLFEEGCQPVLFSKRRMEECGIAWSREGADVAYYPCGFVGSRKFYRVSFDICFPFEEVLTPNVVDASIVGSEEQRAALPHATPQKERDAFVIAFFVVAIFEANWALRLLVVEPMVRLVIGIRGDQLIKFSQSVLEALVYGTFTVIGIAIVPNQPWAWPSANWWKGFDSGHTQALLGAGDSMTRLLPRLCGLESANDLMQSLLSPLQWWPQYVQHVPLHFKRRWLSEKLRCRVEQPKPVLLEDRKEFFRLAAEEFMEPELGLFVSKDGGRSYHVSPGEGDAKQLKQLQLCGKLIGLALLHGEPDMAAVDPEFYQNQVGKILDYKEGEPLGDLGLTFVDEAAGKAELCLGGAERQAELQRVLTATELGLCLWGESAIDLKSWKEKSKATPEMAPGMIEEFWKAVEGMTNEQQHALLEYTTGGFTAEGAIEGLTLAPTEGLVPETVPGYNTLKLPKYGTLAEMRSALLRAATYGNEGAQSVTLNMLTPGVPVMDHLAAVLREHLKRLQAEGQLPGNLQVMVSGPDDAGEGEHKIMLQLVMNESLKSGEDEKHVIVGTDSDLLLVPLALLHGPRAVWVARCEEAVTTASGQLTTLRVCQTEQVVQSLLRQFINLATPTGSLTPKDELHLRLDFLLVTCLRGNDYLPQLASDHDSSELWPRYLRWRQRSQLGLVDLERADADEQICPVLMGVPFADFLSQQGGAWSPQKVTGLSAKEGAQQYLEALLWCLDTYVTGRCPDLHRCWSSSQLGHFAFAALIAQQIPLLEPSCFKAARRDTPPLSPLACALAVLPVTDVIFSRISCCFAHLVAQLCCQPRPCLAPLLETSGLLGEVARLEACGDCSRLSLLVANGPSNGKKAEKNRRALEDGLCVGSGVDRK